MATAFKNIMYGSIALLFFFVIASTVMMSEFNKSMRFCQATGWVVRDTALTNCTYDSTANTSAVTGDVGATNCLACTTFGGYYTASRGLQLLVYVIALIGFGVAFLGLRKR